MPPTLRQNFNDAIAEQKANFLAVISHELRTPMQSIYGILELIEQDTPNPAMRDLIHAAQGSATLMLDLLDDILDFARLDANKLELEQLEIPVRTLVQGVIEAMRVRIKKKQVILDFSIDSDVPTIILGDPKRLRQILFNLVGNALKFTTQGHVKILVFYAPSSFPDQNNLRFEIQDTGIGIDPDVQDRLFQPFTQGDNTVARKYGGAGLGLSICHRLVHLMGGEIGVNSTPEQGSTFWFEIPCISSLYDHIDSTIDLSGLSILAIESHPTAAREIERSLRQMNADIQVVSSLTEARALLRQNRYDVTLTDYLLPDGSSLEFIREIISNFPRMGIIVYTFHEHDGLVQMLKSLGVTYLPKPASRKGLGQTLIDVARRHWLEQSDIPQRILLVEDTISVREILKMQIMRLGIDIDLAVDGFQALKFFEWNDYGLILTDLHMPDMDGYMLASKIREIEAGKTRIPIILLTADIQLSDRTAYLRRGFDDCLTKPVTFHHLRHALQRWGLNISDIEKRDALDHVGKTGHLIDLPRLINQIDGTQTEAINILKSFPVMSTPLLDRLHLPHAHDVAEAAHSLKGAARFACCDALADACAYVQQQAERGHINDKDIQQIDILFRMACKEIETL